MFKARRIISAFVAAVTVLSLVGCAPKTSTEIPDATEAPVTETPTATQKPEVEIKDGGTLDLSAGPYNTLNPLTTNNEDIRVYMGLVYETLVKIDAVLEAQPAIFKSWVYSADCKVWEFTVDEKAVFHDGTRVDAAAVKTLIDYVKKNGGNYAENVENIAGCFVKDESTVQFVLIEPDSTLPSKLCIPMVSAGSLDGGKADSAPVGAGMYKFVSKKDNVISLAQFEEYYCEERKPHIDNVNITVYKTEYEKYGSDFDLALFYGSKTASYIFDETTTILDYTGTTCSYLSLNLGDTYTYERTNETDNSIVKTEVQNPMANKAVRQAINLLLDRTMICNASAADGTVVMLPAYRGTAYWNNRYNVSEKNVGEALKILAEQGYSKSEVDGNWYHTDGSLFVVEMISLTDNLEVRLFMRNVRDCLEEAGLAVKLEELSASEFKSRYEAGKYMIMPLQVDLGNWIDIEKIFATDGELNYTGYSNATVDSYFEQLKSLTEKSVISSGYNAIETILLEDLPVIGLYISGDSIAVREDLLGVKRGSIYAWDPLANFHTWGVAQEEVSEG